jgi:hypothetical protein
MKAKDEQKKVGIVDYVDSSGKFDRKTKELEDFLYSVYSSTSLPSESTRRKLRKKRKRNK